MVQDSRRPAWPLPLLLALLAVGVLPQSPADSPPDPRPLAFSVTVDTLPSGLLIEVNLTQQVAPYSFLCDPALNYTLGAPSPQTNGTTRYIFQNWSDGGNATHEVPCTANANHTAYFATEYLVRVDTDPTNQTILVDGGNVTTPADSWWANGSAHNLSALEYLSWGNDTRAPFANWSDGGSREHDVTVTDAVNLTARYATREHRVTVGTDPEGFDFLVDSVAYNATAEFWWVEGSLHTVEAPGNVTVGDARFDFVNWSDGGNATHAVNVTGPAALTANYVTGAYRVEVTTSDTANAPWVRVDGLNVLAPAAYWWAPNSTHVVEAFPSFSLGPSTRLGFASWSDGGARNHTVNVTAPAKLTANYSVEYLIAISSIPGAWNYTVDGVNYSTAATFWWPVNSTHALNVSLPPPDGPDDYWGVWWGDGNTSADRTYTVVDSDPIMFLVNHYFRNAIGTNVPGLAFSADGFPYNSTQTFWWAEEPPHTVTFESIQVLAGDTYVFDRWSDGDDATTRVLIVTAPGNWTLEFHIQYRITVNTNPPNRWVEVDNVMTQGPRILDCQPGTTYDLEAVTPIQGTNIDYHFVFVEWSDGETSLTRTVSCDASRDYIAVYVELQKPVPPSRPQAFLIQVVGPPGSMEVHLSWEPPLTAYPAVEEYFVYRGSGPTDLALYASVGLNLSLNDAAVAEGTTYYYSVRARNAEGVGEQEAGWAEVVYRSRAYTVTLSTTRFTATVPQDVVVTVLDEDYQFPVAGANVSIDSPFQQVGSPGRFWVRTDANGRAVIYDLHVDDPTATAAWINVQHQGDTKAYAVSVTVAPAPPKPKGWVELFTENPCVFIPGFLLMFLGAPLTMMGWKRYYKKKVDQFLQASFEGFSKKVTTDPNGDKLRHMDPRAVLEAWRDAVASSKEAKLFVSRKFLRACTLKSSTKAYGGMVNGDEECEYFGMDWHKQRMGDAFQIHQDPKPTRPTDFRNEVQAFPIAQEVRTCATCTGAGKITCDSCAGSGRVSCPGCAGSGQSTCNTCGGWGTVAGQKKNVGYSVEHVRSDGSRIGTEFVKTGEVETKVPCGSCGGKGKTTCGKCSGRGQVTCSKCNGSGKIVCPECGGPGSMRWLHRKVWTYKHEILRRAVGPDRFKPDTSRWGEITAGIVTLGAKELDEAKGEDERFKTQAKDASITVGGALTQAREFFSGWMKRRKGEVLKHDHGMHLAPVVQVDVEYPTKEKLKGTKGKESSKVVKKSFTIWAFGSLRGWILDAKDTPTQMTGAVVGLHAAFVGLIVAEVFLGLWMIRVLPLPPLLG